MNMSKLLITNGRVIDPSQSMDRVTNLLWPDGRIAAYDVPAERRGAGARRRAAGSSPRG